MQILICFQSEYKSDLPFFDFDSDMDLWTIAKAFAKENWSRKTGLFRQN